MWGIRRLNEFEKCLCSPNLPCCLYIWKSAYEGGIFILPLQLVPGRKTIGWCGLITETGNPACQSLALVRLHTMVILCRTKLLQLDKRADRGWSLPSTFCLTLSKLHAYLTKYRQQNIKLNIGGFYLAGLNAIFEQKLMAWRAVDSTLVRAIPARNNNGRGIGLKHPVMMR